MQFVRPAFYIGDVHGRADLLRHMLRFIAAFIKQNEPNTTVNFCGDLVDKGLDSYSVLEQVIEALKLYPGSELHRGNHDDWFLKALETNGKFPGSLLWTVNGGAETILSYVAQLVKIDPTQYDYSLLQSPRVYDLINEHMPAHRELLTNASRWSENGPFFISHAGFNPTIDFEEQKAGYNFVDPLNMVDHVFTGCVDPNLPPTIHGHTIFGTVPVVTENRISIDTGAVSSEVLTACYIDPVAKRIKFFQTDPRSAGSITSVSPVLLNRGYGTIMDRLPELFG